MKTIILLAVILIFTNAKAQLKVTKTEITFSKEITTRGLYIEIYNDSGFLIEDFKVLKKDKGKIPIDTTKSQSGTYTIKLVRRYIGARKPNKIVEETKLKL